MALPSLPCAGCCFTNCWSVGQNVFFSAFCKAKLSHKSHAERWSTFARFCWSSTYEGFPSCSNQIQSYFCDLALFVCLYLFLVVCLFVCWPFLCCFCVIFFSKKTNQKFFLKAGEYWHPDFILIQSIHGTEVAVSWLFVCCYVCHCWPVEQRKLGWSPDLAVNLKSKNIKNETECYFAPMSLHNSIYPSICWTEMLRCPSVHPYLHLSIHMLVVCLPLCL